MIKRLITQLPLIHKKYLQRSIQLLTVLILGIMCTLAAWHSYLNYSIIPTYKKQLWNMATQRADDIDTFLNKQEKNAVTLSEKSIIITALHDAYTEQQLPESSQDKINEFIKLNKEQMSFKNILLMDTQGTIIFSTTKNNIVGENINNHSYKQSALTTSWERATMTLTNDFSYFSFDQLLQEPALFLTIPILKDNKFIGTLTYQLNQEKIYAITNQYIGLGKTGEIILGKLNETSIVFVSPSRHDPDLAFKKTTLSKYTDSSIQMDLLRKQSAGIAVDYRGKKVVTASIFIPKVDWGMAVKIDEEEILQPITTAFNLLLLFGIILLLLLLINIYFSWVFIVAIIHKNKITHLLQTVPPILRNPFFIMLLICSGFTIKNVIQGGHRRSSIIQNAKNKAIKDVSENAANIETILTRIASIGQAIADDLQTNYLKEEDIIARFKRDLHENNDIIGISILFEPYAYSKTIHLYEPSVIKVDDTLEDKTRKEQSIHEEQEANIFKAPWYTKAIENGSVWLLNPLSENNQSSEQTATYSCAFFDENNQPKGVVLITYSLDNIINMAKYTDFGQTGYSIILTENGTFIFHPLNKLVQTQTTLLQFAQSRGNEELATIAQNALDGKDALKTYSSEATNSALVIYTQPIKINNWIIGAMFSEDEIGLPSQTIRHYYFWILIWLVMALLAFCGLLCSYNILTIMKSVVIINVLLMCALICSWYIIKITTTINREAKTIITDQASLNKFLNDLNEEAHRKHEAKPITIPFGLFLFSLNIISSDQIAISGYIWSKYDTELHKNISHSIDMPQATRMIFGLPLISTSDNIETVTLNVQGTLFQEQDRTKYPFDQQHIRIIFEHRNIEKNIILTPDLIGYKKISPEATPGLDKEFFLSGFTTEQAFFEYHKIDPSTNFGFKDYGKITDSFQLIYNVIMNRNLLNPFVLYLLPLLVILFSLFCTLLMTKRETNPFAVLGPYTGLFFALVILQRSLREAQPTGSTLYIEYAFFYTYITIMLLILHTILTHYYKNWAYYQETALHFIKLLFWPFQLVSWLITTLIIFY